MVSTKIYIYIGRKRAKITDLQLCTRIWPMHNWMLSRKMFSILKETVVFFILFLRNNEYYTRRVSKAVETTQLSPNTLDSEPTQSAPMPLVRLLHSL
jgi:hypothetical protein